MGRSQQCRMTSKKSAKDILAANLRMLMNTAKHSEAALAKLAGVDPTTINNILNRNNAAKIDSVQAVAKAYGLDTWKLLVENMAEAVGHNGELGTIISAYAKTDETGRHSILKVAEIAARPYRE